MKKKLIAVIGATILGAALLTGCQSFDRAVKDMDSNLNGGLNRVLTVYDQNGKPIKTYQGKFDIDPNTDANGGTTGTKIKFDLNGKRVIIYNATVIVEEQ
jgi:hypothetical protein